MAQVVATRSNGIDFVTNQYGDDNEFSRISLGKDHACAIDLEDKVHCWGSTPKVGADIVPLGIYTWMKNNTMW